MGISKVRGYSFHPWAICVTTGCPWKASASSGTRDEAKLHARLLQHHVQIVQENHGHWAPDGYDFDTDKSDDELAYLGRF